MTKERPVLCPGAMVPASFRKASGRLLPAESVLMHLSERKVKRYVDNR